MQIDFFGNKVFSVFVVGFFRDFPVEFDQKSLFPKKSNVSYVLFCGRGLPALKELDLSHCFGDLVNLTDEVIQYSEEDLALDGTERLPWFTRLSRLWLRGNRITDAGANAIASYPKDLSLNLLDLSDNPIGEDGKRALRKRFGEGVCIFDGDRDG